MATTPSDLDARPDDASRPSFSVSRRAFVGTGVIAGATAFLAGPAAKVAEAGSVPQNPAGVPQRGGWWGPNGRQNGTLLGFAAIAPSVEDMVVVPAGYTAQPLIPWGDPINPDGPAFKFDGTNTAAEQALQFGMGHDGMHFFGFSSRKGVLVVNHEAVDNPIMFNADPDWTNPENVLRSQNAHGVAVCEVELRGGTWSRVSSRLARRITANTPMQLTGPAAGSPLLQTAADPSGTNVLGTFNNCANGATPWGTYLTCEENFNGYFGTAAPGFVPTPLMAAYGVSAPPPFPGSGATHASTSRSTRTSRTATDGSSRSTRSTPTRRRRSARRSAG